MSEQEQGLGIIFHSETLDRINHGLSIAAVASALGRDVKLFFAYGALGYLKANNISKSKKKLNRSVGKQREELYELITPAKKMGAGLYACSGSMGLLNIARDELIEEVDKSMGITTFLTNTANYQLIFI